MPFRNCPNGDHNATRLFGVLIFACASLLACTGKPERSTAQSRTPVPFDRAMLLEVIPLADGSAYVKDLDTRVWYVRGNRAVPITMAGDASAKVPEFSEITATLDGGAYADSSRQGGLWHLRADHAEKVIEATSVADLGASAKLPDGAAFALYVAERKKRQEADENAAVQSSDELRSDSGDDHEP
jgi:hypothetical protein